MIHRSVLSGITNIKNIPLKIVRYKRTKWKSSQCPKKNIERPPESLENRLESARLAPWKENKKLYMFASSTVHE